MIVFDEAMALVRARRFVGEPIEVALSEALGFELASDVDAPHPAPRFDNSAMDGYAVGSLTGPWTITQRIAAGGGGAPLGAHEAAQIFTGAPTPNNTVAVLAQEDAQVEGDALSGSCAPGAHIRLRGEDIEAGAVVIPAGVRVTPPIVAACASMGRARVQVRRKPRVTLIATGSELRSAGEPLGPFDLYDSNRPALASALKAWGIEAESSTVTDDLGALCESVADAAESTDLILTTAGVSVGALDFVRPAMERLNFEIVFSGVAMKPGKPVTFAVRGQTAWLALPGNPMSALTTFALFGAIWLGRDPRWRQATLRHAIDRRADREEFIPCRFMPDGLETLMTVGSHAVAGWVGADGLARIPGDCERLEPGATVQAFPFAWGDQ